MDDITILVEYFGTSNGKPHCLLTYGQNETITIQSLQQLGRLIEQVSDAKNLCNPLYIFITDMESIKVQETEIDNFLHQLNFIYNVWYCTQCKTLAG